MFTLLFALAHAAPIRLTATTLTATVGADQLAAGNVPLAFDTDVKRLTRSGEVCAQIVAGAPRDLTVTTAAPEACRVVFRLDGTSSPTFQLEDAAGKHYDLTFALRTPAVVLPSTPVCVDGVPLGGTADADPAGFCAGLGGTGIDLGAKIATGAGGRDELVPGDAVGQPWSGRTLHYYDRYEQKWVTLLVDAADRVGFTGAGGMLVRQAPATLNVRWVDGEREVAWTFTKLTKPRVGGAAPGTTTCDTAQATVDERLAYVLCVDLTGAPGATGRMYSRYPTRDDETGGGARRDRREEVPHVYLLPNVPFGVVAIVPAGQTAAVSGDGNPGVSDDAPYAGYRALTEAKAADAGDPATRVVQAVLSPRHPGPFRVQVHTSQRKADGAELETTLAYTHELIVLQRYFGALRTGFSFVHAPAEVEYTVLGDDDSAELAIAREAGTVWDPELTVGFSTYLFRRARLRVPHVNRGFGPIQLPYLGLYTGLGVLAPGQGDLGVTALRSVYLGVDLELSPHFSVTVAGVARRSRVPLPPYADGSTLPAADTTWGALRPSIGGAVLLNVTPWYFRQLGEPFTSVGTAQ